jgi:endonuclease/exonuclease/phosphatase family metal-dependent hydrolase
MLLKATIFAGFLAFSLSGHAQDSLRILTWNIQMLPFPAKSNHRAKRAKAIVNILKGQRYDVVAFQEVFKGRSRRIIRKGLREEYPSQTPVLNKKAISLKTNGGVMILSRHPIKSYQETRFLQRTGNDKLARKGAMLAELDVHGKPVQVLSTHLQAFGADSVLISQYRQMRDELLVPNTRPGTLQIICGDLNTRPTSSRYPAMLEILNASNGDLHGEQRYTMDRPNNDLTERSNTRILLDHILIRPSESPVMVRREVKIFRQQWHKEHQDLSDHFALEGVVLLRR